MANTPAQTLREFFFRKRGGKTIEDRLQDVLDDLLTVEQMGELAEHPAGKKLMLILRDRIVAVQGEINTYARDPIKHERELVWAGAYRAALSGLVELVETTLQWRPELSAELAKLKSEHAALKKRQAAER